MIFINFLEICIIFTIYNTSCIFIGMKTGRVALCQETSFRNPITPVTKKIPIICLFSQRSGQAAKPHNQN